MREKFPLAPFAVSLGVHLLAALGLFAIYWQTEPMSLTGTAGTHLTKVALLKEGDPDGGASPKASAPKPPKSKTKPKPAPQDPKPEPKDPEPEPTPAAKEPPAPDPKPEPTPEATAEAPVPEIAVPSKKKHQEVEAKKKPASDKKAAEKKEKQRLKAEREAAAKKEAAAAKKAKAEAEKKKREDDRREAEEKLEHDRDMASTRLASKAGKESRGPDKTALLRPGEGTKAGPKGAGGRKPGGLATLGAADGNAVVGATSMRGLGLPESYGRAALALVARYFHVPADKQRAVQCTVELCISREGEISRVRVGKGSGASELDDIALAALRQTKSFPPLPDSVDHDPLQTQITFEFVE